MQGINANLSGPEKNPDLYYSNCYWVGALHSMTKEWIRGGMREPIGKMVDIGVAMMTKGIRTIDDFGNRCESTFLLMYSCGMEYSIPSTDM